MGWASEYIAKLQKGEIVQFRPHGNSMAGRIESGQLCTVIPVDNSSFQIGDIVLCTVNGSQYLHLIKDIKHNSFQIGNNKGHVNGWIDLSHIYGRCIKIEN